MFEKEEELRALLCGKETQFCKNSMASRPDIMWCVSNCQIMSKILAIYAVGRSDTIKIKEEDELPKPPKVVYFCEHCGKELSKEDCYELNGLCIDCWEDKYKQEDLYRYKNEES